MVNITRSLCHARRQVFRLGGKTVSVTHVPGHTRGSVCLLAEEDRLLFTGDNGNPVLFLFLPNCATLETWLRSAKRMLALARETGAAMYSGHGFSELAEETVQAQNPAYGGNPDCCATEKRTHAAVSGE